MRKVFIFGITGCIFIISCMAVMLGCGGGGGALDEEPFLFTVDAIPTDGEDNTEDIDIAIHICPKSGEPEKGLYPFGLNVTIKSTSTQSASLVVDGYKVTLYPIGGGYLESSYPIVGENEYWLVDPPELPSTMPDGSQGLNNIEKRNTSIQMPPSGTLQFNISVWTPAYKLYYVENFLVKQGYDEPYGYYFDDDNNTATPPIVLPTDYLESRETSFDYNYRLKLYCTVSGDQEKEIDVWGTVTFADWDKCE